MSGAAHIPGTGGGDVPTVTVARLGRRGEGVADGPDGRVLIPLTLPQEVVSGEIIAGRMTQPRVLIPSPRRVRAPCPHYRACGGCALMHADDDFVRAWKAQVVETALAAQGIDAQVGRVITVPARSRRRATLSLRRTRKGALAGFHARASDVIIDIEDCALLRPALQAALPALRELAALGGTRSGEMSAVMTQTETGLDIAVTGGKPADAALLADLAALAARQDWARLDWNGTALTRRAPRLTMGGAAVTPPSGAFLQATAESETALCDAVMGIVGPAARIADLFAGVGTFALPLSQKADVHAVEGLAAPLAALDAAWRGAGGRRRLTTETRDLARRPLLPDELARFDAVVIDPPRAGAAAQAAALAQSQVARVAWVSCDPVTFARDAQQMLAGGYRLSSLDVVDQFRWSPHIESVASFTR